MSQTLPISRLIDVSVNLSPRAAQAQDLSTLLILGSSNVIDVQERLRSYTTIEEVAADFGTTAEEYLAAVLWFGQTPQPDALKIGRWAEADTAARLVCAPLAAAKTVLSAWTSVVNGSFKITPTSGGEQSVTGLDFSGQTNFNGIATVITADLVGVVCVYNSVYERFEFYTTAVGDGEVISFLSAGAAGTDLSTAFLAGRSTNSGAYVVDGIDAETPLECTVIMDGRFGQTWYAATFADDDLTDDDQVAVAGYIEACNNKHLYGISSQDTGILVAVTDTDIASLMMALAYNRTLVQYSSESPYSICSLLGRALSVDYNGNNTVITLMFKQEPGIVAEELTETQISALEGKNCNVFVAYNNSTSIIEQGKVSSGNFIDEITGTDWLAVDVMTAVYNLLYTSPTKIPQTDAGNHLIVNAISAVCSQGVTNGLLAPGVWNSQGFGILKQGGYLANGFYVYAPPVAGQSQGDREARKSVSIQVAAKLAGAVHTVDITINVNR